jgi:hypothetical protein
MARKTGINKKYYDSGELKRNAARKITPLSDENSLFNSDDKIF